MKTKVLYFLFAVIFGLSSCSKDEKDNDGSGKTQSELIIGTWNIYELNYVSYEDGEKVDEGTEQENMVLEIKSDNTFVLSNGEEQQTGTYTVSNGKLFITLDDDEVPEEMQIVKLDEKDFHFRGEYVNTFGEVEYRDVEIYKARK